MKGEGWSRPSMLSGTLPGKTGGGRANPGAGHEGPRAPQCPSDEGGGFALNEGR